MPILSLGLGALGLASKVYGGIKGAQANKEAQQQLDQQFEENEAFFNNTVNKDFLETNAAKGIVEQLRKRYQDQAKTIESKSAATGATPEAEIAAKSEANEQYNDTINSVAQQGTAYQRQGERDYRYRLSDLYRQRLALNRDKAQNAQNVADAGGELLGTAASIGGLKPDVLNKEES